MSGRHWLVFLTTVVLCALCFGSPHANEIPCIPAAQAKVVEPVEHVRAFGMRDGDLVKLSVSSEGYFMITLSPAGLGGAVCIVLMGTEWTVVTSNSAKKEEIVD